jgi:YegS/Rv2252/BmrU family lipid kinase
VIYNPAAGRGKTAPLRGQAEQRLGAAWEWRPTERAGHAVELARQAASEGVPVVAAFGGDGTVGDVARGILGSNAALGIIPMGTGNDVARNLGLPLDLNVACNTLIAGKTRRVDMGVINGTPFLNNAGLGFEARAMQVMNTSIRFVRGKPAFTLAILKMFPSFQPFRMTVSKDGGPDETLSAMMLSVLNGTMYGAGMKACPDAVMDDGELDVLVIKALPKPRLLALFPKVIAGQHVGHPAVQLFRAKLLRVACDPPQPLNVDGDVQGESPVEITVRPGALAVIAP